MPAARSVSPLPVRALQGKEASECEPGGVRPARLSSDAFTPNQRASLLTADLFELGLERRLCVAQRAVLAWAFARRVDGLRTWHGGDLLGAQCGKLFHRL